MSTSQIMSTKHFTFRSQELMPWACLDCSKAVRSPAWRSSETTWTMCWAPRSGCSCWSRGECQENQYYSEEYPGWMQPGIGITAKGMASAGGVGCSHLVLGLRKAVSPPAAHCLLVLQLQGYVPGDDVAHPSWRP